MRKLLVTLLMVLVVSSFAFAAHVDPAVKGAMKGQELIPVIVQMARGANNVNANTMGGKHGHTYGTVFNGFSADLPAKAIEALAKNPNVIAISYNHEVTIDMDVAAPTVNADDVWNAGGYNGAGVTIAIIDTGIYPHQDFGNRIVGWKDIIKGKTAPYDDHGHGTHCAGIAAGNGSTYKGPSYAADLVGVKVLNRRGSGTDADIIAGIEWAVNFGVDIISMSLGGPISESSVTDPSCIAVRNAWNAGVVVLVAAGNEGPSSYTIGSPGNEPKVITVGASNDNGTNSISDDTMASFSSVGPTSIDNWVKPDVCAPGYNITACDNAASGYVTMSGTSMATPLVAGICGQIIQANPSWSNDTIKSNLMNTARDLGYDVYHQGAGLVDVYNVIY